MLHLLHPALVHFTVSLIVLGGLIEAGGILVRRDVAERLGGTLAVLGAASLLPTVATGFLAANSVTLPPGAAGLLDRHEDIGLWLLGLCIVGQFWKAWEGGRVAGARRPAYAALLLAGVALAVWGAFLGGEMVYGRGVGVLAR